jgi:hypothetical protein
MTPQEKAKELVSKYIHLTKQTTGANGIIYNSKQCALIAVDEILEDDVYDMSEELFEKRINYWEQVRQEIINI